MSLFRQISILLLVVFTLLFILILSISFNEIKNSAKESLYENVQNSVSNISLSITNANADISTIKTVLNASFDNGNYEKIVFKNLDDNIVYERIKKEEELETQIPSWFLDFVKINEVSSSSTVSQGWSVLGSLEVFANRESLYLQLYKIFINLSITLVSLFIFTLAIISLLFKTILKPLVTIKRQSDMALENKFIYQEKIPFTKEFKSVTISINNMIEKIQNMFNHANEILKRNKELLYIDELTKLYNRNYLVLKTSEYLEENSMNNKGYIISIIITKIDLLNKKIGYDNVDKLFLKAANIMADETSFQDANIIARTNAAEFIIVLPRVNEVDVKSIARHLSMDLNSLFEDVLDEEIELFLGLCHYKDEKNHSELLAKIDYTLNQSKVFQGNDYYYLNNSEIHEPKQSFREIINLAKEKEEFNILYRDIVNLNTKQSEYKTISFEIKNKDKVYSYGEFIGTALELDLLEEIYLKVIEKVLKQNSFEKKVAIQIPSDFISTMPFDKLKKIFEYKKNSNNIIFEIEEESFTKYAFNCVVFLKMLDDYGFNVAIFNFMGISEDYDYLKIKKPEYIKVNQRFLQSLESLDAINMIKNSLGIKIIATSINDEEDLKSLENKNINLISGKVIEKLI